jgi:hypothetical protein
MPRFSIRFLLFLFTIVALWLSTAAGYRGAPDVRSLIVLSVLVAAGVAAISYDGRRRAFWAGFFITLWALAVEGKPVVGRLWITQMLNSYGLFQNLPNGYLNNRYMLLDTTLQSIVIVLLATLMGFIGVLIYGRICPTKTK